MSPRERHPAWRRILGAAARQVLGKDGARQLRRRSLLLADNTQRLIQAVRPIIIPWLLSRNSASFRKQVCDIGFLWRSDGRFPDYYFTQCGYRSSKRGRGLMRPGLIDKTRDYLNRGTDRALVRNKRTFRMLMEECGVPVIRERFCILPGEDYRGPDDQKLSEEEVDDLLKKEDTPLFVKQLNGAFGAHAFKWQPGTAFELPYRWMSWIVQPVIQQHVELSKIHPASVNTLRIMTLAEGDDIRCELAFLRMGDDGAILDNAPSGGLAAPLDLDSGTITGAAIRLSDEPVARKGHDIHPKTGAQLVGRAIPFVPESVELVEIGARRLQADGFASIGWDVVIGPHGPIVLEANDGWTANGVLELHDVRNSRLGQIASSKPWQP